MTADKMKSLFLDTYSKEAIQSIDRLANELGLVEKRYTIEVFNLREGTDSFIQYLEEFCNYKLNEKLAVKQVSMEKIKTHSSEMIESRLFNSIKIEFKDLPEFVKSYIDAIDRVNEKVQGIRSQFISSQISPDDIGVLSDMEDKFYNMLKDRFDRTMQTILTASGFNTQKKLNDTTPKPYFL